LSCETAVHRIYAPVLAITLLVGACKVEETPRQYIDRRDPAATDREAIGEELSTRLPALAQALNRNDPETALAVLAPAPDLYVVGPQTDREPGGADGVLAVLREVAQHELADVAVQEVHTSVGPRGNVAWFAARFSLSGLPDTAGTTLRLSGVYVRREGEWRLVQAHLSLPSTSVIPLPAPPNPPGDSVAPE
jgi:ketosteroid isomerase-like protein